MKDYQLSEQYKMSLNIGDISEKPFIVSDLSEAVVKLKCVEDSLDNDVNNINGKIKGNSPIEFGKKGFRGRYAGIVLAVLSALIFSLGTLIVKFMKGYHPFTLAVYRLQGILWPSIILLSFAKCGQKKDVFEPIWPLSVNSNRNNFAFLLIRGITGCTGLIMQFYCLKYLTIADSTIIGCIKPVLVTFIAHLLLGEKAGFFSLFVAVVTILGAGVIVRPPILTGSETFDRDLLIGAAYRFGSILITTFNITIIRHCRKLHYSVVLLGFGTSGTIFTLVLSLSFGVFLFPQENVDLLYAVALAAIAFMTQTLGILALKKEQAGTVSVIKTIEIVFAIMWQCIFLGVLPDIFSLIGAAIVILGVILTVWSKWISSLPTDNPTRKRYSFVLK